MEKGRVEKGMAGVQLAVVASAELMRFFVLYSLYSKQGVL